MIRGDHPESAHHQVLYIGLSEPLAEARTDHIDFVDASLPRGAGFPPYGPPHELIELGPARYEWRGHVPAQALPGRYLLTYLNRVDRLGNFEDLVGEVDAAEESLRVAHPLVVDEHCP
jgi:hypothetical protein